MKLRSMYMSLWDILAPARQMVFIAGPRQAGKTTFTEQIRATVRNSCYLNWDEPSNRRLPLTSPHFYEAVDRQDASKPVVVFDELHKYPDWKNYLKGIYDRDSRDYKFVVSGSGRLDAYRKGGDSLAGRYFLFYLWPFTIGELGESKRSHEDFWASPLDVPEASSDCETVWEQLSRLSGFPDPFLNGTEQYYRIWSRNYRNQLLQDELRDLAEIRKYASADLLYALLPERVGRPLSMNALAEDVQVSFDSIRNWLLCFDQLFLSFRLSPWSKAIARSIRKEKKLFLFDCPVIQDAGLRFENQVALELWRAVHNWTDKGLGEYDLNYIRTRDGDEVDFLITEHNKPKLLIEIKLSRTTPSASLLKFQSALGIPGVQLVERPGTCRLHRNGDMKTMIVTASRYLSALP